MSYRIAFLAWPPSIRRSVYEYVGLADGDTHIIPLQSKCRDTRNRSKDLGRLLRICRSINIEVSAILYSNNRFHLSVQSNTDLRFLRNLRPQTIALLQDLSICVGATSCQSCGQNIRHHQISSSENKPGLSHEDQLYSFQLMSIVTGWQSAIGHVLEHVSPCRLNLRITCDTADHEIISMILKPLQIKDIALAACSLDLVRSCRLGTKRLAQATANSAVRAKPKNTFFRLMDLPTEIRLAVLSYTDLIAPLKEVYWDENKGYSLFFMSRCDDANGYSQPESFHHACQFRICRLGYRCRSRLNSVWKHVPMFQGDNRLPSCFKRFEFDALVPADWKCRCWAPPKSLFLVCWALHAEAELVFFKENRFVIHPVDGFCTPPVSSPVRFGPSIFLSRLRPSAAKSLRVLELVFPPFNIDYCPVNSEVLADWDKSIRRAKRILQLSKLTLRVYMADHLECYYEQDFLPDFRHNMSEKDGEELIKIYQRVLTPLAYLTEIQALPIYLSWPWQWLARTEMGFEAGRKHSQMQSDILQDSIGPLIFGGDLYLRSKLLEDSQIESQWSQWTRNDFYG